MFFPKFLQLLHSEIIVSHLIAASFEEHPFDLVTNSQDNLYEKDTSGVETNCEQNNSLFGVSRHKEIDIEENKSEQGIEKQPK